MTEPKEPESTSINSRVLRRLENWPKSALGVCLLWPDWPASDFSRNGENQILSHRTGGHYKFTAEVKEFLDQHRNELFMKRRQITAWLINQREQDVRDPELTMQVLETIDPEGEVSIEQGVSKLLVYLSQGEIGWRRKMRDDRPLATSNWEVLESQNGEIGDFIDQAHCLAASECEEWDELGVYMDLLEQQGYVRKSPIPNSPEWNHYAVTFQGYQAAKDGTAPFAGGRSQYPKANQVDDNPKVIDKREVFIIHGRNEVARIAIWNFLEAIGLEPILWEAAVRATGAGSPYIGQILDAAFYRANAVISLMTPDEEVVLKNDMQRGDDPLAETTPSGQARPNVIFETGMALAKFQERTIIVNVGNPKTSSDITGRHTIRLSDTEDCRRALAQRLETAGCPVDLTGSGWQRAGDFLAAIRSTEPDQTDGHTQSMETITR